MMRDISYVFRRFGETTAGTVTRSEGCEIQFCVDAWIGAWEPPLDRVSSEYDMNLGSGKATTIFMGAGPERVYTWVKGGKDTPLGSAWTLQNCKDVILMVSGKTTTPKKKDMGVSVISFDVRHFNRPSQIERYQFKSDTKCKLLRIGREYFLGYNEEDYFWLRSVVLFGCFKKCFPSKRDGDAQHDQCIRAKASVNRILVILRDLDLTLRKWRAENAQKRVFMISVYYAHKACMKCYKPEEVMREVRKLGFEFPGNVRFERDMLVLYCAMIQGESFRLIHRKMDVGELQSWEMSVKSELNISDECEQRISQRVCKFPENPGYYPLSNISVFDC